MTVNEPTAGRPEPVVICAQCGKNVRPHGGSWVCARCGPLAEVAAGNPAGLVALCGHSSLESLQVSCDSDADCDVEFLATGSLANVDQIDVGGRGFEVVAGSRCGCHVSFPITVAAFCALVAEAEADYWELAGAGEDL